MIRFLLCCCLLFGLDGCAIVAANAFEHRSEERYVLRPDDPSAELTCNGRPCKEVTGVRKTSKESILAFVAVAVAEGACTALAARSHHSTGSTGPEVVADVCGGLLAWDLVTVPLAIPLAGMFGEHRDDRLDDRVELTLDGVTTQLHASLPRVGQTQTFSVRAAFDRSVDLERKLARMKLCHRAAKSGPLQYEVPPIQADDDGILTPRLAAQLDADLGPPSADRGPGAALRAEGTITRREGSATLELRWLAGGPQIELGRSSVTAASVDGLAQMLPALAHGAYDASCLP